MYDLLYAMANPVGIVGLILLLTAYFLLSTGRWNSHSMPYQLLNFISAWLILFSLYFHWNLSSVLIEIAWIIISAIGMVRVLLDRKSS